MARPSLAAPAWLVAAGAILSGPVGMALSALHPQPPWRDAATWAAHYHALQTAPFWLGFILVSGCVWFVARAALLAGEAERGRVLAALVATAAFAAIIVVNYTLQVAFVPWAARHQDPAAGYFVMANPGAICWAFEMFGYGVYGVATWLVAPVVRDAGYGRAVAALLSANGVVSVAGAVVTGLDLEWVHRPSGLVSFAAWNVLLIATMILCAVRSPQRRQA